MTTERPDPGDTDGEKRYPYASALRFTVDLLVGLELPRSDANDMAVALLDADLGRIKTHGLRLLPAYLHRLLGNAMNPTPSIDVIRQDGPISVVAGDDGFGQVVAKRALDHTIEGAREHGLAMTVVRGSNHFGALGYPARLAAEQGMFAFVGQNTRDIVVLPGGERPGVGNNPFAFAMPSGHPDPLVLDISCSRVAKNNIYRAAERGEPIPEGIAVDEHGNPTTDAHAALRGAVTPFGGHKGAGLAIVIGALAGVLSDAKFGPVVPAPTNYDEQRDIGHFFLCVDLGRIDDPAAQQERMRTYLGDICASGADVRYPGQRSGAFRRDSLEHGVLLPTYVIDDLVGIARDAGVDLSAPLPVGAP